MVFCCRVSRVACARLVVACSRASNPLAPTPVVGRVDHGSAHHTRHLRAEEVARPWTGRPGNRAIQGSRGSATSRPGSIQARSAWLTPATPSEQPHDSVRVPWPDQIWPDFFVLEGLLLWRVLLTGRLLSRILLTRRLLRRILLQRVRLLRRVRLTGRLRRIRLGWISSRWLLRRSRRVRRTRSDGCRLLPAQRQPENACQ